MEADILSRPPIPTSYHQRIGETLARKVHGMLETQDTKLNFKIPNQTSFSSVHTRASA